MKYSKTIDKYNKLYLFKWKNYSCIFDSILFILKFKLSYLFANSNYDLTNRNSNNLFSYCNELTKYRHFDFEKGFLKLIQILQLIIY